MMLPNREKLAVLIVSYGNPSDVARCLNSLGQSTWTQFEVFVCENAGNESFRQLEDLLTGEEGVLQRVGGSQDSIDDPDGVLTTVTRCQLRGRGNTVRLAAAKENLGYGGGVNAWLKRFLAHPGWEAILVLNPDTEVGSACLSELMTKAGEGFGMVGGTLVYDDAPDKIINYGLYWSRTTGRITAVGRNLPAGSVPSSKMLANIDAISGACVLVTRAFIDEVGLMAEEYFLYMEDLDWGQRRGQQRIGFAPKAVVRHVCSASIGSAMDPKERSALSIYLTARNGILHARRWAGWRWVIHFAAGMLTATQYIIHGAPYAAIIAFIGLIDGARGKTGQPSSKF